MGPASARRCLSPPPPPSLAGACPRPPPPLRPAPPRRREPPCVAWGAGRGGGSPGLARRAPRAPPHGPPPPRARPASGEWWARRERELWAASAPGAGSAAARLPCPRPPRDHPPAGDHFRARAVRVAGVPRSDSRAVRRAPPALVLLLEAGRGEGEGGRGVTQERPPPPCAAHAAASVAAALRTPSPRAPCIAIGPRVLVLGRTGRVRVVVLGPSELRYLKSYQPNAGPPLTSCSMYSTDSQSRISLEIGSQ